MTPTPHRTSEASRIKRANQALRQCHQILVRSAAEDALLRGVGQSLVAACRYDVAWIGSLAEVDTFDLRHEACATPQGAKGGVTLAGLWSHGLERRTIGTAIRNKKAAVARDVLAWSGASRSPRPDLFVAP